jgi:hypothetical protein
MGVSRHWRYSKEKMKKLIDEGRVIQTRPGAVPQLKRYLDEMPGVPLQDVWVDLPILNNRSKEMLGYPTQKPVALLERIVATSSNEGDVVLDPFCGCGTTIHAAQKLNRQWTGIDLTPLAIALVENRLRDTFGADVKYETYGIPKDLDGARALFGKSAFEFERWAVTLIPGARPFKSKGGGDQGVDGLLYFKLGTRETGKAIISVKGGRTVNPGMVRDLRGTIDREKAEIGLFITLTEPSRQMIAEAASSGFFEHPYFAKRKFPAFRYSQSRTCWRATRDQTCPSLTPSTRRRPGRMTSSTTWGCSALQRHPLSHGQLGPLAGLGFGLVLLAGSLLWRWTDATVAALLEVFGSGFGRRRNLGFESWLVLVDVAAELTPIGSGQLGGHPAMMSERTALFLVELCHIGNQVVALVGGVHIRRS